MYILLLQINKPYINNVPHSGGRTPSYGYMTPSHDPSRTPLHGSSAWDPSVSNTPARYSELNTCIMYMYVV